MMEDIAKVLRQLMELRRRTSNMVRHGTIEEIKGGMVRVRYAEPEKEGGQPFLSPWMPQGDTHYGNVREEIPYKKGQNVSVLMPGANPNQATLWPFSSNEKNKRPKHAVDDQHTRQWEQAKHAKDGNLHRWWIEEQKEDDKGPDPGKDGQKDDRASSRSMVETSRDKDSGAITTTMRCGTDGDAVITMTKGLITIKCGSAIIKVEKQGGIVHINPPS